METADHTLKEIAAAFGHRAFVEDDEDIIVSASLKSRRSSVIAD